MASADAGGERKHDSAMLTSTPLFWAGLGLLFPFFTTFFFFLVFVSYRWDPEVSPGMRTTTATDSDNDKKPSSAHRDTQTIISYRLSCPNFFFSLQLFNKWHLTTGPFYESACVCVWGGGEGLREERRQTEQSSVFLFVLPHTQPTRLKKH